MLATEAYVVPGPPHALAIGSIVTGMLLNVEIEPRSVVERAAVAVRQAG